MTNFASLASTARPVLMGTHALLKRLTPAILVAWLAVGSTGCGTLGDIAGKAAFWRDGDAGAPVVGGQRMSEEDIAQDLIVTAEQMRLNPGEPYWMFHMGELHAALGDTQEAVPFIEAALEADPSYAPAVALLSKIYYEDERYEDGIGLLDGFMVAHPNAPDALWAALALHLEALGALDEAHAALDRCSDSEEARATRTFVALRGDAMDSALETATQAVKDNPRSAANLNNYGIALLLAGRPEDAREAFLSALDRDEKLPGALYNMAIVETFYFFDETSGRKWFNRYQKFASDDPDDLGSVLGTDLSKVDSKQESQ